MSTQSPGEPRKIGRASVKVRRGNGRGSKVKFGDVTITGARPTAALVKANIKLSTRALERVSKSLAKPGIALRAKKGVPQFSVAEDEPGVFIRRLDGRIERGRVIDGIFQVID